MRGVASGEYTDWYSIDYRPAIAELLPHTLISCLSAGKSALDIGCNTGGVSLFLAKNGLKVLGVDINTEAIRTANERAEAEGLCSNAHFVVSDITGVEDLGEFDVVLMVRLLTCFPSFHSWRLLLRRAYSFIKEGGILYVNDFKLAEGSEIYQQRYEAGIRLGWRKGNFAVNDKAGHLLFVAHHHTDEEINEITSPYTKLELNFHKSLSMNGNECEMFEFIGRK